MTVLADLWTISDLRRTTSVTIAVLSGSIFNLILYGVLTVQIYLYYICFSNDHITLKTSIYVIYATETAYTVSLTYDLICLMLDPLHTAAFTSLMIPVCGGIVAILTQAVYAYRIRILTRMIAIPLGIVVIVVVGFVLAVILIRLRASFYLVSFVSAVSCLVVDVTVSIIMIWNLTKTKVHSKLMQRRVTRLIHIFIGGGILTVAVNIVTLIASLLSMKLTISSGILQSKIYANSMMVLLNNRATFGHRQTDMEVYFSESSELGTFRVAAGTTTTHGAQDTSTTTDFTDEKLDRKENIRLPMPSDS